MASGKMDEQVRGAVAATGPANACARAPRSTPDASAPGLAMSLPSLPTNVRASVSEFTFSWCEACSLSCVSLAGDRRHSPKQHVQKLDEAFILHGQQDAIRQAVVATI